MTLQKQKTFMHGKKNALKKKNLKKMVAKMENQSLTDSSWKEKARISPRTYRGKKDRWKIEEKLSQRKVQEVQHQNNGSPTKRMMMEKKCATDEMSPLKFPSARRYTF